MALKLARMMRGAVPEWNDDYIEQQIPADICQKMHEQDFWVDADGFTWGFKQVFADKDSLTGDNICILAGKALGQGCHEVIFVREGSGGVLERKFLQS